MENMIEIKGLRKAFGSAEVLKGVDLSIKKGEIVVLIGARRKAIPIATKTA